MPPPISIDLVLCAVSLSSFISSILGIVACMISVYIVIAPSIRPNLLVAMTREEVVALRASLTEAESSSKLKEFASRRRLDSAINDLEGRASRLYQRQLQIDMHEGNWAQYVRQNYKVLQEARRCRTDIKVLDCEVKLSIESERAVEINVRQAFSQQQQQIIRPAIAPSRITLGSILPL
ncbi:hypothetical protein BDZ89DRAFT_1170723 [Hymenopellis radicata]|nr:hypothetical protein BDZ89DRAFT_1170723 [Hymenopellis radicata]